jgi:hypothetical protein
MKSTSRRAPRLVFVALALAALPGLLLFMLARTSLFARLVKVVGTPTMLTVAIVLLAVLIGAAVFSLVYGFGTEDPLRRQRRSRHGT